jgi:ankyrin repeat protein
MHWNTLKSILLYGVDINVAIPSSGKTAFMIACEFGYDAICSLFLVSSLDKDARDNTVGTALDWAWEFEHVDLCKKLLKAGFDKQSQRNKVLLLRKAVQKENNKLIELFFTTWKKWNSIDDKGNTILHYACKEGFSDVVQLLFIFLGTNNLGPLLRNKKGKTARAIALAKGDKEIELLLSRHRVTH